MKEMFVFQDNPAGPRIRNLSLRRHGGFQGIELDNLAPSPDLVYTSSNIPSDFFPVQLM